MHQPHQKPASPQLSVYSPMAPVVVQNVIPVVKREDEKPKAKHSSAAKNNNLLAILNHPSIYAKELGKHKLETPLDEKDSKAIPKLSSNDLWKDTSVVKDKIHLHFNDEISAQHFYDLCSRNQNLSCIELKGNQIIINELNRATLDVLFKPIESMSQNLEHTKEYCKKRSQEGDSCFTRDTKFKKAGKISAALKYIVKYVAASQNQDSITLTEDEKASLTEKRFFGLFDKKLAGALRQDNNAISQALLEPDTPQIR